MLHQAGAFHELGAVQLEPMGYASSPAMGVPQGPPTRNGYVHPNAASRGYHALQHAMSIRFKLHMTQISLWAVYCDPANVHL